VGIYALDRMTGKPSADYLKIHLPGWVNELPGSTPVGRRRSHRRPADLAL